MAATDAGGPVPSRTLSDESYVIDLCDELLGTPALRQHRFDWLRGDARLGKHGVRLPVDAYYPDLQLVVEYREHQHTEAVPFMDRKMTISGVHRGAQRAIYDQRRREVLPQHGIELVELSYADFAHDKNKRLLRRPDEDLAVVRQALAKWIRRTGSSWRRRPERVPGPLSM
jgi:hypothetical protein